MSWIVMDAMSDGNSSHSYDGTSYTSSNENKNLNGYNFSLGYEFNLGKRLSLETGIKYQTRGFRMISEYNETSANYRYNETSVAQIRMKYVDIPIVLNTSILVGDVNLYARTGVYVGILTSAAFKERSEYSSSDGSSGEYEYDESYSSNIDFKDRITGGLIIGAGVEYKGFYFESNYSTGILSFSSDSEGVYTKDLSFSLGYKIKFNKE